LTHSRIAESFSRYVEPNEVVAQKWSSMKIGSALYFRDKRGRSEPFVQNQIGDFRCIEIVGGDGVLNRKGINCLQTHVLRIPIGRILTKPDPIVKSPFLHQECPIVHQVSRLNPIVPE